MNKKIFFIFIGVFFLFSCNSKQEDILKEETILDNNIDNQINIDENLEEEYNTGYILENKQGEEEQIIYVEGIDGVDKNYEIDENIIDKQLVTGLVEDLEKFNDNYKLALFNTGKENKESVEQTTNVLHDWQDIVEKYLNKEVEDFSNTSNLDEKLLELYNIINDANGLVRDSDLLSAHEQLEEVRQIIYEIRKENNIENISDDMLVLHNIMEEIVEDSINKNEENFVKVKSVIEDLKKYYIDNEEYITMLNSVENVILELEKLESEEYTIKLQELKPAFIKMYLQFG